MSCDYKCPKKCHKDNVSAKLRYFCRTLYIWINFIFLKDLHFQYTFHFHLSLLLFTISFTMSNILDFSIYFHDQHFANQRSTNCHIYGLVYLDQLYFFLTFAFSVYLSLYLITFTFHYTFHYVKHISFFNIFS